MTSNLDIWRSANLLLKQYGEDAAFEAAVRADKFLAAGDMGGCAVWKRILKAIEELRITKPIDGTSVH